MLHSLLRLPAKSGEMVGFMALLDRFRLQPSVYAPSVHYLDVQRSARLEIGLRQRTYFLANSSCLSARLPLWHRLWLLQSNRLVKLMNN